MSAFSDAIRFIQMHWPKEEEKPFYENVPNKPKVDVTFDNEGSIKGFTRLMNCIEKKGNLEYILSQATNLKKEMQKHIDDFSDNDLDSYTDYYKYTFEDITSSEDESENDHYLKREERMQEISRYLKSFHFGSPEPKKS